MIKKRRKLILFSAAACLVAAAIALSSSCLTIQAADDFVIWKNAGTSGEKKSIGLTLQLAEFETFEESATFQVAFSVKTKDGNAVPEEDCLFVFDDGLSSSSGDAVVQDWRFAEEGKLRIIVSGRKDSDGNGGILNKKEPLFVGKLSVAVYDQDVEISIIQEECHAVNERGNLVPITDFGNLDSFILKAENAPDENEPDQPNPPKPPEDTDNSKNRSPSSNRGIRRLGYSRPEEAFYGPGAGNTAETKGTWQQGANGTWLFLGETGYYAVDTWIYVGGYWYRMGADGVMLTGWHEENGKRYYLNTDGRMVVGWCAILDQWYYFNPVRPVPVPATDKATGAAIIDAVTGLPQMTTEGQMAYGEMYKNTVTPDGFQVNERGERIP